MEQSVRKKQIILLAAGGLVTFACVVAHYLSPISRRLAANEDVELVLLSKDAPMLFIYHSFSRTVNVVRLPSGAARGGSAYQRACEVLKTFTGNGGASAPSYIEVQTPDMDAFKDLLNNWRARPAILNRLAYLVRLKKNYATNLSVHDILILTLELSRVKSSSFIIEDFDNTRSSGRSGAGETAEASAPGPETVRLEILNASGRKDLAGLVMKYLRGKGFDVISFSTYGGVERFTKIVNCSDNLKEARVIRDALNLGGLEIHSKFDKLAIAQVKVILGADFDVSNIANIERGIR